MNLYRGKMTIPVLRHNYLLSKRVNIRSFLLKVLNRNFITNIFFNIPRDLVEKIVSYENRTEYKLFLTSKIIFFYFLKFSVKNH